MTESLQRRLMQFCTTHNTGARCRMAVVYAVCIAANAIQQCCQLTAIQNASDRIIHSVLTTKLHPYRLATICARCKKTTRTLAAYSLCRSNVTRSNVSCYFTQTHPSISCSQAMFVGFLLHSRLESSAAVDSTGAHHMYAAVYLQRSLKFFLAYLCNYTWISMSLICIMQLPFHNLSMSESWPKCGRNVIYYLQRKLDTVYLKLYKRLKQQKN